MSVQARHIDWEFLDSEAARGVRAGDIVSAAAGGLPIYRIMSLGAGRAWLRDIETGAGQVTPLTVFPDNLRADREKSSRCRRSSMHKEFRRPLGRIRFFGKFLLRFPRATALD